MYTKGTTYPIRQYSSSGSLLCRVSSLVSSRSVISVCLCIMFQSLVLPANPDPKGLNMWYTGRPTQGGLHREAYTGRPTQGGLHLRDHYTLLISMRNPGIPLCIGANPQPLPCRGPLGTEASTPTAFDMSRTIGARIQHTRNL